MQIDPQRSFNFRVEISGAGTLGLFTSVDGIGVKNNVIRFREAGHQGVRALPGQTQVNDITLNYGVSQSNDLWLWMDRVSKGTAERKSISIILLSNDGASENVRWNLFECFPCEWNISPLDAMSQGIAIAKLKLACERIELAS